MAARILASLCFAALASCAHAQGGFPLGLQSYQSINENQVDYGLARFNTEVQPCLALVRTDWKADAPVAQTAYLCSFKTGSQTFSLIAPGVNAVDYYDLIWDRLTAHFVIEYSTAATVDYYQCSLPVTAPTLALSCKKLDTDLDTWEKQPHKSL